MANYVFYDHPVGMRLEDKGYGVPLVQAAEAFAEAFVAVDTQVVTETAQFVSVVARNSLGQTLTTNFNLLPFSGTIIFLTIKALDLRLYYYGSVLSFDVEGNLFATGLSLDAQGNPTGNISQSWAQVISTGAFIGKFRGFVAPFTEEGLGSADAVILANDDIIIGSSGNDYLLGYAGNDRIEGGAGYDILNRGVGTDILMSGSGDDQYILILATVSTRSWKMPLPAEAASTQSSCPKHLA